MKKINRFNNFDYHESVYLYMALDSANQQAKRTFEGREINARDKKMLLILDNLINEMKAK